jgi:hypothetical protein
VRRLTFLANALLTCIVQHSYISIYGINTWISTTYTLIKSINT